MLQHQWVLESVEVHMASPTPVVMPAAVVVVRELPHVLIRGRRRAGVGEKHL